MGRFPATSPRMETQAEARPWSESSGRSFRPRDGATGAPEARRLIKFRGGLADTQRGRRARQASRAASRVKGQEGGARGCCRGAPAARGAGARRWRPKEGRKETEGRGGVSG